MELLEKESIFFFLFYFVFENLNFFIFYINLITFFFLIYKLLEF